MFDANEEIPAIGTLKLKFLRIRQLFGIFNYSINLDNSQGITIIYGLNGTGKTTVLNFISWFADGDISKITSTYVMGLDFEFIDEKKTIYYVNFKHKKRDLWEIETIFPNQGIKILKINKNPLDPEEEIRDVENMSSQLDTIIRSFNCKLISTQRLDISKKVYDELLDENRDTIHLDTIKGKLLTSAVQDRAEKMRTLLVGVWITLDLLDKWEDGGSVKMPRIRDSSGNEQKIELFHSIINDFLTYKSLKYHDKMGFRIIKSGEDTIDYDLLSSGEKNLIIIFFDLIFGESNLVLLDEPEISLHVAWQIKFLSVIKKINKLTNNYILIATHSPDIIHNHINLCIGPELVK